MPKLCSKLAYYAGIMLNALASLLCLKLCRHNRRRPTANHGQSDAQQMETNQPNLEHQQSDTVEPISKEIVIEHQESVTNEPTLDNQSNY